MLVAVAKFLTQRMEEDDTYQGTKEAILRYLQVEAGLAGPCPMDCSSFKIHDATSGQRRHISAHEVHRFEGREKHSICEYEDPCLNFVANGKGKGKVKPFPGQCHCCGRWRHSLAECPAKDNDMGEGKGKGHWSQWDGNSQGRPDFSQCKTARQRQDRKVKLARCR